MIYKGDVSKLPTPTLEKMKSKLFHMVEDGHVKYNLEIVRLEGKITDELIKREYEDA